MNNAELIKALRNCSCIKNEDHCKICGYRHSTECGRRIADDAADALEAAEQRIAELERILKAVQENSGINFRMWQEAEAQLPKEGEWIWDTDTGIYRCSECGGASPREDQDGEYIDCPNYCPNCGAKMKGERNDHQRM